MSSSAPPSDQGAQANKQGPQSGYPPPGAPPPGAAGQQPYYPYPPQGGYAPPLPAQGGYYSPPPPGQYYAPPPPGQYYAPPPGQYQYPYHPAYYAPQGAPPPGQYPPPASQPGQPGAPGGPGAAPTDPAATAASPQPGTPGQPSQYAPPPGGYYPPPGGAYPPMPGGPGFPPGGPGAVPGFLPPFQLPPAHQDPLLYLGTPIPNPEAPPAAHGVQKVAGYDPAVDYNEIVKAISASNVGDEKKLLRVITPLNVFQMDALNDYFVAKTGIKLADRLDKSTAGNFGTAIRALALGPLWFDVDLAHKSIIGVGTNETALIELILGRPGHEIRWLKKGYQLRYGRDLVSEIRADLSGKLEQMFVMALNTQKPVDTPYAPPDQRQVEADIESLHNASKKRDEITFCEILINRSDSHLAAVIAGYGMRYKSLSKVIKKTFSGTMEEALLYIMHGVKPKRDRQGYWRDAKLLEKSMAGLGTKDNQLIYRLVRAHWSPPRLEAIKDAYKRRYGKTLEHRVKGETSGPYRDLLVAILKSSEGN